jgi:hypothetical protein
MISESVQIREHELFLQLPQANALDERILSQVALMQILTKVHDQFAERRVPHHQDSNRALLNEEDFPQMRAFNLQIDSWRIKWHARQHNNPCIGTFPSKGIILYSYFAKLQLNSFAIRGISITHGRLSTERKEFANMAISAAASILTFVLEEEDLRRALVGTPLSVSISPEHVFSVFFIDRSQICSYHGCLCRSIFDESHHEMEQNTRSQRRASLCMVTLGKNHTSFEVVGHFNKASSVSHCSWIGENAKTA